VYTDYVTTEFLVDSAKSAEEQKPEALPALGEPSRIFLGRDWSSDGKLLLGEVLGVKGAAGGGIVIYSMETKSFEKITPDGANPTWLPDNKTIVYQKSAPARLFIVDRTVKQPRELLAGAPDAFGLPAFSSDGRTLYFRALRDEADIWMLTLP
jgi:hypothetical protein